MFWDSEYKELIENVKKQAGVSQAKLSHIWDVWTISAYWSRLKISLLSHSDQHLSFLFLSNAALALTKVGLSWLYYRKIHPAGRPPTRQYFSMIDRAIYPKQKTIHCVRDVFKKSQKTVEPPIYLGLFTKSFGKSGIQKFTPLNPTFRLLSSLDFKIRVILTIWPKIWDKCLQLTSSTEA